MSMRARLLGLTFASADLLIELDDQGTVVFALGSGPCPELPCDSMVGRPFAEKLTGADVAVFRARLAELAPGRRSPCMELLVTCGDKRVRRASLRLFQLPDVAPNVSCAIQYEVTPPSLPSSARSPCSSEPIRS
jgi:hypothetical protein